MVPEPAAPSGRPGAAQSRRIDASSARRAQHFSGARGRAAAKLGPRRDFDVERLDRQVSLGGRMGFARPRQRSGFGERAEPLLQVHRRGRRPARDQHAGQTPWRLAPVEEPRRQSHGRTVVRSGAHARRSDQGRDRALPSVRRVRSGGRAAVSLARVVAAGGDSHRKQLLSPRRLTGRSHRAHAADAGDREDARCGRPHGSCAEHLRRGPLPSHARQSL